MKYWHPHLPFGQHISVSTLVSIWKNEYVKKQSQYFYVYMHHGPVLILETLSSDVHDLSDYMHVWSKIYQEFYTSFSIQLMKDVVWEFTIIFWFNKWAIKNST